ncbi:uncharacterized protein LOC132803771 [Ziziphus jujuba]|uniref:Uncharacterized protein LOC132803771 n=1 Tax=Ziziphus jujuba TaxID=326968 RepID=A0ABM4A960_ZIZJJ|nr:uncharacterized protein LOC132803771 [Ziziphus jujuba]
MDQEESAQEGLKELPALELKIDITEANRISNLTLVGRIISEKTIKRKTVQMITRRIWFTHEPAMVDQLSHKTFLFSFKRTADRARVWNRRPWTINGAHLALKEWDPVMSVQDFDFSSSTFWVQIHGLPLQYLNKDNAIKIGGLFKDILNCEGSS